MKPLTKSQQKSLDVHEALDRGDIVTAIRTIVGKRPEAPDPMLIEQASKEEE